MPVIINNSLALVNDFINVNVLQTIKLVKVVNVKFIFDFKKIEFAFALCTKIIINFWSYKIWHSWKLKACLLWSWRTYKNDQKKN